MGVLVCTSEKQSVDVAEESIFMLGDLIDETLEV